MKVSAIVVSRMDRPLGPVLDSIIPHVEDLTVVRGIDGVWERWLAVAQARQHVVYVQDDDAIVDVPAVMAEYEPGLVTCNMPMDRRVDYPDGIALVGWGAVFHRGKPALCPIVFADYLRWWWRNAGLHNYGTIDADPIFRSECDRVFTGLSKLKLIDVPFTHLPEAFGTDRMGRRECHGAYTKEIRRRIYAVRRQIWQ